MTRFKLFLLLRILIFTGLVNAQQTMGLFVNDPESVNGYTLFSNNEYTYLIDNCGYVVNNWESEYKCNNGLFLTADAKLYRIGRLPGQINFGGAGGIIERYDWSGTLEWSFQLSSENAFVHHDMLSLSNGNLLITVWSKKTAQEALDYGRIIPGVFYDEQIWELKPMANNQAEVVWKWSALDHTVQDVFPDRLNYANIYDHPELIDINYVCPEIELSEDWLHVNSLDYNEEFDQIVFCSRNTSEIYVIDHSTTTQEASSGVGGVYGKGGDILYRYGNPQAYAHGSKDDRQINQAHDVQWIEGNDFIIFNNLFIENFRSRIQIWNNPTESGVYTFSDLSLYGHDSIYWSFEEQGFYSSRMSSVQHFENGNILCTEGNSGTIFEITADKEIVWHYVNPVNANGGPGIQTGTPQFNYLFKSQKYPVDFEGFIDIDNYDSIPIELSPIDNDCNIYSSTPTSEINEQLGIELYENVLILNTNHQKLFIEVYDSTGRLVKQIDSLQYQNHYQLDDLPMGLYFFRINNSISRIYYLF